LKITKISLGLLTAASLCAGAPARAEEQIEKLDRNNIQKFLDETRIISTDPNTPFTTEDIIAYFTRHITEDGIFMDDMTMAVPGMPEQKKKLSYTRNQYIEQIIQGRGLMQDYKTNIDVKEIKIAFNKKTATLETVTNESGTMMWPDQDGTPRPLKVKGTSECVQSLAVSDQGYIAMQWAHCITTTSFSK